MLLPASLLLHTFTPKFQIKLFKKQPCQLHQSLILCARHRIRPSYSMRTTKAQFGEPSKIKLHLSTVNERLREAIPDSVKDFPWKKAEDVLLQRLVRIGHKALQWSLITLFVFSSLSDVIYSISRNQELLIPFGLLVGYLMTDLFKEILQEIFQNLEEKRLNLPLLSISCFFVLVKVISALFTGRLQIFLLHVANGGLMQALYLWRNLLKVSDKGDEENLFTTGPDT